MLSQQRLKSSGKVVYDPNRSTMKKRTKWWCVLNVDREITRYYRWWVKRKYHIDLCQPSWDAHVSIIRGEKPEPELMHLWKKYDGQVLNFEYSPVVYQGSGETRFQDARYFWFVDVVCPEIIDIRKELNRPVDFGLHLTIGRTYYI